jgi:type II secretory pathway component PulJ
VARTHRAFTLTELLLGVSITALIGLSSVTLGSVLTSHYSRTQEYYQAVQVARIALMRLQTQFRGAQLVTQVSASQIIVWREPNSADGQINPSELILLTYSGGTIRQYQIVYPPDLSAAMRQALDAPVSLGSVVEQPAAWAVTIQSSWYATSKVLATNLSGLSVSADVAVPMTRMVTISLTSGQGQSAATLRSATWLRADKTGSVALVGGHYALAGS